MRWCSLLILLAPLGASGGPVPDAAKKELEQFQGSWKAVATHADGRQATDDEVQSTRLIVEGCKFTLTIKQSSISGTFTVNPAKTPRTIDVQLTSNEGRQVKFLGIYQIQGDKRKSCFALPGKERPTSFSPAKGYFGFEWRRS
jgi:uncharacterized protein (TIGR03067 family)